jgi:ribonucleoside-triphosphate reductase
MLIKKRDEKLQDSNLEKISIAISGAFNDFNEEFDDVEVLNLIEDRISKLPNPVDVEVIQDVVEDALLDCGYRKEAKAYIKFRHRHELLRKANTTDRSIKELLDGDSEFWNKENSNKNAKWVTTQRDYIAGITSKDIARRFVFPEDVIAAHDAGIIHIHDMDYVAQNTLHNCDLINLNDMLQNGTVVNGVTIDKPHRLSTAMTIATQIIAAVASSQYGGCTVNLVHLAPFVRDSYNMHYCNAGEELRAIGVEDTEEARDIIARKRTKKEIADSVQTLNYQLNSLTTTNGQSPFVSVFMYLGDTDEYKDELAALIEEVLNQRILGMKNKVGVYVTVAFPK